MCCFRKLSNFIAGLVFILLIVAAVGWWYLAPRMDQLLEDAIRREFMLDADSTVMVSRGSLLDTLEGEVDSISVGAPKARLDNLVVEELELIARGVTFDMPSTVMTGRAELSAVSEGELSFRVPAEALEERWADELSRQGLSELEVTLVPDVVTVTGRWGKPVALRIEARGGLSVEGTEEIRFVPEDVSIGGVETGLEKVMNAFGGVAPVVDLGRMQKLLIVLDQVAVEKGYISVKARSMSLKEKLEIERQREAEQDSQWEDMKLKLPTLEEAMEAVTGLFVEKEPQATDDDASESEDKQQEGTDGGNGTE